MAFSDPQPWVLPGSPRFILKQSSLVEAEEALQFGSLVRVHEPPWGWAEEVMVCVVVVLASRTGNGLSWQSCSREGASLVQMNWKDWVTWDLCMRENLDSLCECWQWGKNEAALCVKLCSQYSCYGLSLGCEKWGSCHCWKTLALSLLSKVDLNVILLPKWVVM